MLNKGFARLISLFMSINKTILRQLFALQFALLLSGYVYSQTDTTTAIITGKIIKISYLVKDWNADGDKIYHIYWSEIALQNCKYQNPENGAQSALPDTLVFESPKSGLAKDIEPYHVLKSGDNISISTWNRYIIQYIENKKKSILIGMILK
jgi:hypothetical protein